MTRRRDDKVSGLRARLRCLRDQCVISSDQRGAVTRPVGLHQSQTEWLHG
jgi:hypothetical protein